MGDSGCPHLDVCHHLQFEIRFGFVAGEVEHGSIVAALEIVDSSFTRAGDSAMPLRGLKMHTEVPAARRTSSLLVRINWKEGSI